MKFATNTSLVLVFAAFWRHPWRRCDAERWYAASYAAGYLPTTYDARFCFVNFLSRLNRLSAVD